MSALKAVATAEHLNAHQTCATFARSDVPVGTSVFVATPPAQPEPGAGELAVVAWRYEHPDRGGYAYTESPHAATSNRGEALVTKAASDARQSQAQAKIARLEGEVATARQAQRTAEGRAKAADKRALRAEADAAKVRAERDEAIKHLTAMVHVAPRAAEVDAAVAFLAAQTERGA